MLSRSLMRDEEGFALATVLGAVAIITAIALGVSLLAWRAAHEALRTARAVAGGNPSAVLSAGGASKADRAAGQKLADLAKIVPGVALWSFAALMILFTAACVAFDPRQIWAKLEAAQ